MWALQSSDKYIFDSFVGVAAQFSAFRACRICAHLLEDSPLWPTGDVVATLISYQFMVVKTLLLNARILELSTMKNAFLNSAGTGVR